MPHTHLRQFEGHFLGERVDLLGFFDGKFFELQNVVPKNSFGMAF